MHSTPTAGARTGDSRAGRIAAIPHPAHPPIRAAGRPARAGVAEQVAGELPSTKVEKEVVSMGAGRGVAWPHLRC